jgi:hypothetical protein
MTVREPHNNSSRVEREILEILEKADASVTPIDKLSSSVRRRQMVRPSVPDAVAAKMSPPIIKLVASLVLALLAATISGWSHLLGVGFAIASAIALFSLWLPASSTSLGEGPRWRGRDLGDKPRFSGGGRGNFPPRNGPRQPRR